MQMNLSKKLKLLTVFAALAVGGCGSEVREGSLMLEDRRASSILLVPKDDVVAKRCKDQYAKTHNVSTANSAKALCIVKLPSDHICSVFLSQCFDSVTVPFPPGTVVPNDLDLKQEAENQLACGDERDLDSVARNKRISAAYVDLYKDHPYFKWAGMAAFASDLVGKGISISDVSFLKKVNQLLVRGNNAVYKDVYQIVG